MSSPKANIHFQYALCLAFGTTFVSRPRSMWREFINLLVVAVLLVGLASAQHSGRMAQSSGQDFVRSDLHGMNAGSQARAALQTIIASGQLHDLRWPDFSDYRVPLGNSLSSRRLRYALDTRRVTHPTGPADDFRNATGR